MFALIVLSCWELYAMTLMATQNLHNETKNKISEALKEFLTRKNRNNAIVHTAHTKKSRMRRAGNAHLIRFCCCVSSNWLNEWIAIPSGNESKMHMRVHMTFQSNGKIKCKPRQWSRLSTIYVWHLLCTFCTRLVEQPDFVCVPVPCMDLVIR